MIDTRASSSICSGSLGSVAAAADRLPWRRGPTGTLPFTKSIIDSIFGCETRHYSIVLSCKWIPGRAGGDQGVSGLRAPPSPGRPGSGSRLGESRLTCPGEPGWYPDDAYDDGSDQRAAFADGGWADTLEPCPVLATLVDLVQRDDLGKLDDDQLTGALQAANRLAAWAASVRVAAVSSLAARREQSGRKSGDWRPFDHVDDEVAVALTLTRRSAARLLDLALGLDRLPLTRAALAAGMIDERRAEVIAEEVAELDDEHAAAVEKLIIGRAPDLTSGQLRALVRRAVLSADPEAARRRKEKALKDARVEMFPETSGTAALAGRDLPPAGVLAADKHLTALAQAMKAAGQPGTLDTLRAWAYLHLLSGQPAATLIPTPGTPASGTPASGLAGSDPPGGPGLPMTLPDAAPAPGVLRGSVNLTMPLSTWLGWTQSPGDVPGYGPVDAEDSRTLGSLLARSPGNQWCVTLTGADGHPVAHACARHGPPSPGPRPTPATLIPGQRASPVPGQRPSPRPRATTQPRPRANEPAPLRPARSASSTAKAPAPQPTSSTRLQGRGRCRKSRRW